MSNELLIRANISSLLSGEVIGYIGRTYSGSQNPSFTLGPYVIQAVFLLIAPALFAASIYMELGKLSDLVDAHQYLVLPRRWITRTFVCGDVICFLLQAGGASLMASDNTSTRNVGTDVVVAGLFVQIIFFGGFVVTSLIFHLRLRRNPTPEAPAAPYARHLFALYASSILIFARSIVRVVEFVQGFSGYVISHEVFLYVFDAAPMLLTMVVMNWIHPSEINGLLKGVDAFKGLRLVRLSRGA